MSGSVGTLPHGVERGVGRHACLNACGHHVFSNLNSLLDVGSLGEFGGDGGGEGAPGTGDPLVTDLRGGENGDLFAVPQDVNGCLLYTSDAADDIALV